MTWRYFSPGLVLRKVHLILHCYVVSPYQTLAASYRGELNASFPYILHTPSRHISLLLRENICRDPLMDQENCDTLGLAELATMCNDNSCAIVQDNGLSAAFTIVHELSHV